MLNIEMYIDPFDYRDYFLYWSYNNKTNEIVSDFNIDIFRSIDGGANFKKIKTGESLDKRVFKDRRTSKWKKWINLEYKILLRNIRTGKEYVFGPVGLKRKPTASDQLKIDHLKKQLMMFGNPVVIAKLNDSGERCSCWNEILGKTEDSNCRICNGVGYVSGYKDFYFCKIKMDKQTIEEYNSPSEIQRVTRNFVLSNFPNIGVGDLIIDRFNKRYTVLTPTIITPNGITIKQFASVSEVSSTDFEMKIEVPQNFKDILNEL